MHMEHIHVRAVLGKTPHNILELALESLERPEPDENVRALANLPARLQRQDLPCAMEASRIQYTNDREKNSTRPRCESHKVPLLSLRNQLSLSGMLVRRTNRQSAACSPTNWAAHKKSALLVYASYKNPQTDGNARNERTYGHNQTFSAGTLGKLSNDPPSISRMRRYPKTHSSALRGE